MSSKSKPQNSQSLSGADALGGPIEVGISDKSKNGKKPGLNLDRLKQIADSINGSLKKNRPAPKPDGRIDIDI